MDRHSFLKQEVAEGPARSPAMPPQQVAAHIKELQLLSREFSIEPPGVDLSFLRSIKALPGNPFYEEAA